MGNWFGAYFCNWFGARGSVVVDASVRELNRFSGEAEKKIARPKARLDQEEEELVVIMAAICGIYDRGLA